MNRIILTCLFLAGCGEGSTYSGSDYQPPVDCDRIAQYCFINDVEGCRQVKATREYVEKTRLQYAAFCSS